MHARNRVEDRARRIFAYLDKHRDQRFRKSQVIAALRLTPSATTEAAFRRARLIAHAQGLHLRHAVPHNGLTVMVTNKPDNALDSALHMDRIAAGVRKSNEPAWEFMRRNRQDFGAPDDRRAFNKADRLHKAVAEVIDAADEAIAEIVRARRS